MRLTLYRFNSQYYMFYIQYIGAGFISSNSTGPIKITISEICAHPGVSADTKRLESGLESRGRDSRKGSLGTMPGSSWPASRPQCQVVWERGGGGPGRQSDQPLPPPPSSSPGLFSMGETCRIGDSS